mmetsp:Transcript_5586/g.8513  ORF Transcript_5586/g.8513 Transcript_5586/m.8513 type:complete len:257 (-) Transcript_5586:29-799(-)
MSKRRRMQTNLKQTKTCESYAVTTHTEPTPPHNDTPRVSTLPPVREFISLTSQSASRLLYPNPVCFLSTMGSTGRCNVMTISWLTAANNHGGMVFVIHKSRFSAKNLLDKGDFILSVAHAGQKDLLLEVGKVSGKSVDKCASITDLNLQTGSKDDAPANVFSALDDSDEEESSNEVDVAPSELCPVDGTVAHMRCTVKSHSEAADPGHWMVVAQIDEAYVHPQYWDGKCFSPVSNELPPLLSFVGSQRFAFVRPEC